MSFNYILWSCCLITGPNDNECKNWNTNVSVHCPHFYDLTLHLFHSHILILSDSLYTQTLFHSHVSIPVPKLECILDCPQISTNLMHKGLQVTLVQFL